MCKRKVGRLPPYRLCVCFVVPVQLCERNIEEKYAAAAEAAVMEDKCRAEAGWWDLDDSVCEIYFKVSL